MHGIVKSNIHVALSAHGFYVHEFKSETSTDQFQFETCSLLEHGQIPIPSTRSFMFYFGVNDPGLKFRPTVLAKAYQKPDAMTHLPARISVGLTHAWL
jgi:hypothetical protein